MNVRVGRWGNSLAIRLPKDVGETIGVQFGTVLDLTIRNGRLVLTPTLHGAYSGRALVQRISPQNLPQEAVLERSALEDAG